MTKDKFKNIIGILFIVMHLIIIGIIIVFRLIEWYTDDILKVTLPIIMPIFASFTAIIVDNIQLTNRDKVEGQETVTTLFKFAALAISIAFFLLLLVILMKYAIARGPIENLAMYLGIVESAFALYVIRLVKTTFIS